MIKKITVVLVTLLLLAFYIVGSETDAIHMITVATPRGTPVLVVAAGMVGFFYFRRIDSISC